jgi:hypothetical protein
VEGQALLRWPVPVVLPHPGDQPPIGVQGAEVVGEAFAHHRGEASGAVQYVVVDGERRHAIGLEGDRTEADLDQLGEEFVADRPESGLLVGLETFR